MIFIFECSWVKGVMRATDIVFLWLSCTYYYVQHSGEVISLNIRRHIFLRVLGMLHCCEDDMYDLLKRLDWDGHPCFKTKLPIEHAIFGDTQIVHDTVET